jgi:5'-nucleotidase
MRALTATVGLALVASSATLITTPAHAADPVDVNILGINDFHGRIKANGVEAGAAVLAGAVDQIRAAHPNTIFAAAGDLIGASTFDSFIAHDKPTIDALNEAGLEVSAVGNHEFDQGYDDLVNRVMAPYDADTNPYGGAEWKYIGANVTMRDTGDPALDPTYVKDLGGVQVGFIGAVTEHLPELVSPSGIADIQVTDIPTAVNAEADTLKSAGVDVIVLLVHEGAPSTDCATMDDDPTSDFGSIITGVNDKVDAIISGHTHLAYNCKFPVAGWTGRPVTERPVVSAGQYGYNLNQLDLSVDPDSGQIQSIDQSILPLTTKNPDGTFTANYPADAATKDIVDRAVAEADVLGAVPLGDLAAPFKRATKADGSENRGGESTLGNFVADVQRWATRSSQFGGAQIAFMNPGGLRADMVGNADAGYPAAVTYRQAANVQPFANTLVNMRLTGAQISQVLEQQWQPEGASRPFLRLGTSNGFKYAYDPDAAPGKRIGTMWLHGQVIQAKETYSVTVNSFLASGGDNFTAFKDGTNARDTGRTDLQAMVDYMAAHGADNPATPVWRQHAVGLDWLSDAVVRPGSRRVKLAVSSWAFTGAGDVQDTKIFARTGKKTIGSFAVDNTIVPLEEVLSAYDETGTSRVVLAVPVDKPGTVTVRLVGNKTGTVIKVPVRVKRR